MSESENANLEHYSGLLVRRLGVTFLSPRLFKHTNIMGQEIEIIDDEVQAHFIQRINPNTPIYRIFTLERGLEAVVEKKLSLARPHRWEDPYENALYHRQVQTTQSEAVSLDSLRNCLYAQCWTEDGNSDALWRIYSPDKNGFRATTTVGKLLKAISENAGIRKTDCSIGKVNYCHQEIVEELFSRIELTDFTDSTGLKPVKFLLIKRNAFQHEREVRVAYNHPNSGANPHGDFKSFDIDPNTLFDRLLFDPRISEVEYTNVVSQIRQSGYTREIGKSTLYGKPVFNSITI